jgi:hypothetical protein
MQHLRRRRQIKPLLLLPQNQWAVPWRQIRPLPQMRLRRLLPQNQWVVPWQQIKLLPQTPPLLPPLLPLPMLLLLLMLEMLEAQAVVMFLAVMVVLTAEDIVVMDLEATTTKAARSLWVAFLLTLILLGRMTVTQPSRLASMSSRNQP